MPFYSKKHVDDLRDATSDAERSLNVGSAFNTARNCPNGLRFASMGLCLPVALIQQLSRQNYWVSASQQSGIQQTERLIPAR